MSNRAVVAKDDPAGLGTLKAFPFHPVNPGLSLTRQLKADAATAAIPIVALTAYAMRDDREQPIAAGCN